MNIPGVDFAWQKPDPAGLKADGIKFAMRYLSHDATKNLTLTEKRDLQAHGISVGLVWESTANRALAGKYAGYNDAKAAGYQAASLGLGNLPVYFAVDFDVNDAQKLSVREYLQG